MIPTGMNGRIEGTFLVNALLAGKKISIPKDDLVFQDGRHKLLGVSFSDGLREDGELTASLKEITEDLIRLFYEVEKDERLHVSKNLIGGTLRPYIGNEDMTGMTLLNLFSNRFITFEEAEDGSWGYKMIGLIRRELPDADRLITCLLEDVVSFSGSFGNVFSVGEEDLTALTAQEQNVRKNVEGTLTALHNMMEELDEQTESVLSEDVLAGLSFERNECIDVGNVRVQMPDGFCASAETDGHRAILYRPNAENPDVYESSGVVYYLDTDSNGGLTIRAEARVKEQIRASAEAELVSRLWGHVFTK